MAAEAGWCRPARISFGLGCVHLECAECAEGVGSVQAQPGCRRSFSRPPEVGKRSLAVCYAVLTSFPFLLPALGKFTVLVGTAIKVIFISEIDFVAYMWKLGYLFSI